MSLDAVAELMGYWERQPPTHVAVWVAVKAITSEPGGGNTPPAGQTGRQSAERGAQGIEALASMFGPPQAVFRPPCRMQPAATEETARHG